MMPFVVVALLVSLVSVFGAVAPTAAVASPVQPGVINLGPPSVARVVGHPVGTPLSTLDRDAGLSVHLSDGNELWLFADTTFKIDGTVIWFSNRGTGALGPAASPFDLTEPSVANGYLVYPSSPLIAGGTISCPPGLSDYYWPTSAVALPQGGGRDRVLIYYQPLCGVPDHLETFVSQPMGVAEYDYDTAAPPSVANPIVAQVRTTGLFPTMPGHSGPGTGYGAASVAVGNDVYVYGCHYSPMFQNCDVARATAAGALSTSNYTYWNGSTWVADPSQAADMVMPSSILGIKGSVAWVAGANKFAFVDNDFPNAQIAIRWADHPQGPWTAPTFVPLSDCNGGSCWAAEIHGGLSTTASIALTYYRQGFQPGMREVQVPLLTSPVGAFDTLTLAGAGKVAVDGWVIDPDTAATAKVAVYIDDVGLGWFPADSDRADVRAAYPAYGSAHGFSLRFTVSGGSHSVCAYGINSGPGDHTVFGCRTIFVPSGDPLGALDSAGVGPGLRALTVTGWALDPDSVATAQVAVYIDGIGQGWFPATGARPDIANAFPGFGAAHGYALTFPVSTGSHNVCTYGIDIGPGLNAQLGCRTVIVASSPVGAFDSLVAPETGTIVASGWAIEPDTTAPAKVAVYIDGLGVAWWSADASRPDVAAAYPGSGAAHGFVAAFAASPGPHQVCTYAINVGPGSNTALGCRTVRA